MKLIIAIIQPHKLDDVMRELDEQEIHLKTVTSVLGCGRQKGVTEVYRGVKEVGTLLKKTRLEIAVNDAYVNPRWRPSYKGGPHGEHRGRQDFRPPHGGMHKDQERREREKWQSAETAGKGGTAVSPRRLPRAPLPCSAPFGGAPLTGC